MTPWAPPRRRDARIDADTEDLKKSCTWKALDHIENALKILGIVYKQGIIWRFFGACCQVPIGPFLSVYFEGMSVREASNAWKNGPPKRPPAALRPMSVPQKQGRRLVIGGEIDWCKSHRGDFVLTFLRLQFSGEHVGFANEVLQMTLLFHNFYIPKIFYQEMVIPWFKHLQAAGVLTDPKLQELQAGLPPGWEATCRSTYAFSWLLKIQVSSGGCHDGNSQGTRRKIQAEAHDDFPRYFQNETPTFVQREGLVEAAFSGVNCAGVWGSGVLVGGFWLQ